MDRCIVCGVDGSADSQAALAVAVDLAARLRLRLIMANVVEPSHAPYAGALAWGSHVAATASDNRPAGRGRQGATHRAQRGDGARAGRPTRRDRLRSRAARRSRRRRGSRADRCGLPWTRRIQSRVPRQRLDQPDWRRALPGSGCAARRRRQVGTTLIRRQSTQSDRSHRERLPERRISANTTASLCSLSCAP